MNKKAFTLIELSIVLVIIGLIIGAITAANKLVEAAALQNVISEINDIKTAFNAFELQYQAYPGDFDKAYDYFGTSCDTVAADCNGNGNRLITYSGVATANEEIRIWQHLTLAEILPGSYAGEGDINSGPDVVPFASRKKGKFFIENVRDDRSFGSVNVRYSDIVMLGLGGGEGESWWNASFTVGEALSIDSKIDDGIANAGKLYGVSGIGYTTECSAEYDVDGGADYNRSNTTSDTNYCMLEIFIKKGK
tara:strand:- start:276 stop:1025 length:750 start_codon:yes stop_codon:yes gene_type:complete